MYADASKSVLKRNFRIIEVLHKECVVATVFWRLHIYHCDSSSNNHKEHCITSSYHGKCSCNSYKYGPKSLSTFAYPKVELHTDISDGDCLSS